MKFNSAQEMLDVIVKEENDLYNPNTETYVFVYSDCGSICYYSIDKEHAKKLAKLKEETGEYWGAFLGPGGWIVDDPSHELYDEGDETPLDWCENYYKEDGWEVV